MPIIPTPVKVEAREGKFQLKATTSIHCDAKFKNEAKLLAERLRVATGFPVKINPSSKIPGYQIGLIQTDSLGGEQYSLSVTASNVVIQAPTAAGAFYGAQSLLQLLPPEIFSSSRVTNVDWQIPCVEIQRSAPLRLCGGLCWM